MSISVVLYALLGGTQTTWGPLVGAAVFTLLPELLRGSASLRYVVFAAGVIIPMALRAKVGPATLFGDCSIGGVPRRPEKLLRRRAGHERRRDTATRGYL